MTNARPIRADRDMASCVASSCQLNQTCWRYLKPFAEYQTATWFRPSKDDSCDWFIGVSDDYR